MDTKARAKKLKSKLLKARERGLSPSPYRVPGFLPQCFTGGPLLEMASLRDLGDGEGGYVADALGRTMLLPIDMDGLRKMRMQEFFLSTKRYLGMVKFLET